MRTVFLLLASNISMTFAWYYHLQQKGWPFWKAITLSWAIAFFEYCLMVPANRYGFANGFSGYQLKMIQEVIPRSILFVCPVCFKRTAAAALSYQLCISARRRLFHVQEIMLTKRVS
jgi:uncharacterized protein (DUF486 family)